MAPSYSGPISVLGVGTRDYALFFILTLLGASQDTVWAQTVSLSLLMLVMGGMPQAVVGYIIAIKEHVTWKEAKSLEQKNEKK